MIRICVVGYQYWIEIEGTKSKWSLLYLLSCSPGRGGGFWYALNQRYLLPSKNTDKMPQNMIKIRTVGQNPPVSNPIF